MKVSIRKYKTRSGANRAVFNGKFAKTSGGLQKSALTKNKNGKIVSKKKSARGKASKWIAAVAKARKALGIKGFCAVGGKAGKGKDSGKGECSNELTVFVRGLPWSVEEELLKKDFAECGEIERLSLPLNEEGKPKGISFIKFKTQEGVDAALKFDSTEYGGRTIYVSNAGEGGKGKDGKGKGKDGKGKGKDGKGKAKGKGKKGGMSTEKKAAKDGAMVECTGEKKTFEDSDDE